MGIPAGWVADPTQRHELRYWDGVNWTGHVSDAAVATFDPLQPAPPVSYPTSFPAPYPAQQAGNGPVQQPWRAQRDDPGFLHFLRFLLILVVMYATIVILVGLVWYAFALAATGRRKRDILMMLIPVWSLILLMQTLWRYTAKNVYWSVRPDMVSKSLFSG